MFIKQEAVWALSNCTASANPHQFNILVQKGMIKALGSVLKINDVRMLTVALEGLDNTLQCGDRHYKNADGDNMFAIIMEQEGCLDDLEELQQHPNHNIYTNALKIIDNYFSEEQEAGDNNLFNMLSSNAPMNSSNTGGAGLFDL